MRGLGGGCGTVHSSSSVFGDVVNGPLANVD